MKDSKTLPSESSLVRKCYDAMFLKCSNDEFGEKALNIKGDFQIQEKVRIQKLKQKIRRWEKLAKRT